MNNSDLTRTLKRPFTSLSISISFNQFQYIHIYMVTVHLYIVHNKAHLRL